MTTDELNEIRARLEAATPGPWVSYRHVGDSDDDYGPYEVAIPGSGLTFDGNENDEADAQFIAHAPTDIRTLLDAIAERDATLTEMQKALIDADVVFDLSGTKWMKVYGHLLEASHD